MIRWTIERIVDSAQEAETVVWSTFAARKAMLSEMAALGLTATPSLRALADEAYAVWFIPENPDKTYVRVVADHAEPAGLSA